MDDGGDRGSGGAVAAERVAWSEELGARIVARTAAGETLRGMCREAGMPAFRTVEKWPAFRTAMAEARAYFAESAFQTGWEICMSVTPATAMQCKVQLAHLRWRTGKLAPKRYGPAKPQAAEDAPESEPMTVIVKNFRDVTAEDYAEAEETERRFGG